jgi:DNA-binding NarL/FixJ family response regulator
MIPRASARWAAEFGVSPSTIAKMVRKAEEGQRPQVKMIMGRDGKMRPDRRYDITARDALIVDLRSAGFLMREIASEVSCSVGTVHRVISRAY